MTATEGEDEEEVVTTVLRVVEVACEERLPKAEAMRALLRSGQVVVLRGAAVHFEALVSRARPSWTAAALDATFGDQQARACCVVSVSVCVRGQQQESEAR